MIEFESIINIRGHDLAVNFNLSYLLVNARQFLINRLLAKINFCMRSGLIIYKSGNNATR